MVCILKLHWNTCLLPVRVESKLLLFMFKKYAVDPLNTFRLIYLVKYSLLGHLLCLLWNRQQQWQYQQVLNSFLLALRNSCTQWVSWEGTWPPCYISKNSVNSFIPKQIRRYFLGFCQLTSKQEKVATAPTVTCCVYRNEYTAWTLVVGINQDVYRAWVGSSTKFSVIYGCIWLDIESGLKCQNCPWWLF